MQETRIDEPVPVQTQPGRDGAARPLSFVWRERIHTLAAWGRQWREEVGGEEWRCLLAQTAAGDTVELRYNPRTHQWRLARAWWRDPLV